MIKNLIISGLLTGLTLSGSLLASTESDTSYDAALADCEDRKAKRLFRGCMNDYKGSPVFRKRCQTLSESRLDSQKPVCKAMVDKMKAAEDQEKTGH